MDRLAHAGPMGVNMDWSDFFGGFSVGFGVGVWIMQWIFNRKDKESYPFQYICLEEGCHFVFRSNDASIVATMGQAHKDAGKHGAD
jgi:hypothetical protein